MKRRNLIFTLAILAVVAVLLYYRESRKAARFPKSSQEGIATTGTIGTSAVIQGYSVPMRETNNHTNQHLPKNLTDAEKWAWWQKMGNIDPYFAYKMPITFYGKVIDDKNEPIDGASIDFTWTDLSSEGTSTATTKSDASGSFSLRGVTGKGLSVNVSKSGYSRWTSKNRTSFEYAMFANTNYYQPDSNNPIVFVMRKNRQGVALIVRTRREASLEPGEGKSFPIGAGNVFIQVERLPFTDPNANTWSARVTVPNGGLMLTSEEFPFEAPESGYTNVIVINRETPHPYVQMGDLGAMFYVKTPAGYGRAIVYYVANMPWVYVESWFNPNSNSRNLELDPSKEMKLR